jgi:Golgi SNAP receptor complex protein 2
MAYSCCCALAQDAQRKALDIINSVGLGDSVLKMIEKRQRGDIYLVLGGMVSALVSAVNMF